MMKILVYKNMLGFMRPRPENEPWEPLPEGVELIGYSMDGCHTIELLTGGTIDWPAAPQDVYDHLTSRVKHRWEQECIESIYQAERAAQKAKQAEERALAKTAQEEAEQKRRVTYEPRKELCKLEARWAMETFSWVEEEPPEEETIYEQEDVLDLMESNSVFWR
jgi:HD superfamily phosphohydrolase